MSVAASIDIKGWCPGVLRPMPSGDGLIVRVRPCCGAFRLEQARGLADIAAALGNGHIDLTRRANLQIRGLARGEPARAACGAGQARPDRSRCRDRSPRNVMVEPLAGLDPAEKLDVRPMARASPTALPATNGCAPCRASSAAGRWRRNGLDRGRARRYRAAGDRRRDCARPRYAGGHGLAGRDVAGSARQRWRLRRHAPSLKQQVRRSAPHARPVGGR